MLGKGEIGLMVCGPVPGMLKTIVSVPAWALAAAIDSRRVHSTSSQTPVPGSAVELTMKVVVACGDIANGLVPSASINADDARSVKRMWKSGLLSERSSTRKRLSVPSLLCGAISLSALLIFVDAVLVCRAKSEQAIPRIKTRRQWLFISNLLFVAQAVDHERASSRAEYMPSYAMTRPGEDASLQTQPTPPSPRLLSSTRNSPGRPRQALAACSVCPRASSFS